MNARLRAEFFTEAMYRRMHISRCDVQNIRQKLLIQLVTHHILVRLIKQQHSLLKRRWQSITSVPYQHARGLHQPLLSPDEYALVFEDQRDNLSSTYPGIFSKTEGFARVGLISRLLFVLPSISVESAEFLPGLCPYQVYQAIYGVLPYNRPSLVCVP